MATSTTFNITTGVTSFTCDFVATDSETVKCYIVSTGAEIDANDYTISGRAASSSGSYIVISWAGASDYVGEQLIVRKWTNINTGAPADAMLSDFTTVAQASREVMQNEFAHLYGIVGDITGGDAVGTYDLGDIGTLITRLNDLADDIFTTTTNSGTPAVWDGTNTLSIGGDSNVQSILTTHETRLDTAETDITNLEATDATHTGQLAGTTSSGLKTSFTQSITALQNQINSGITGLPATTGFESGQAEVAASVTPISILAVDTLGALEYIDFISNAQALIDASIATANADAVVWVAGGYVDDLSGGGAAASAVIATPTAPVLRSLDSGSAATLIGGTAAHATKWAVEDSAGADPQDARLWMPTALSGAGYTVLDFEVTAYIWDGTAGNLVAQSTNTIEIRAVTASNLWTIHDVPGGANQFMALTIKRVKAI